VERRRSKTPAEQVGKDLELIRPKQLCDRWHVSPWTLRRWVRTGKLPPPVRLSPQVIGWQPETLAKLLIPGEGER
jgi:predicted DNA-binding transcriptional regulator AlpA